MYTNVRKNKRDGSALLVVLFVVMAVTILSLGFLSRSDAELACGQNMVLRAKMDYLAESGLEHAMGMILNPQEVSGEYWGGELGQQLVAGGDDYYGIRIVRDDSDPANRCNYTIDCNAFRLRGGQRIAQSSLSAELRLDPCIALWVGSNTTVFDGVTVNGDIYCGDVLTNSGTIDGDVFANGFGGIAVSGQQKAVADLSLQWPGVTVADSVAHYTTLNMVSSVISNQTFGPFNPVRACCRSGDLEINSNNQINGLLIVDGNLSVSGAGNVITAGKNSPAMLVTGDMIIEDGGSLVVRGLVIVEGQMRIGTDNASVDITGGLFVADNIVEMTADSTVNDRNGVLYNEPTWQPAGGRLGGALEFDGINDTVEDATADGYLNGLPAVTLSLWVKSDVIGEDRGIIFTREPTGNDEELGIRYDMDGAFGGGSQVITASIKTTLGNAQIESSPNVQTTGWQHLVLVWASGSNLELYINNVPNALSYQSPSNPLGGTVTGVEKLMLGCGTYGQYWDGMIDDVRIYNRMLDANDVSNLYNFAAEPTGLIMRWKLDEQGGDTIEITAAPALTAIVIWPQGGGQAQRWGQAAGAFFRSIHRR